MKTITIKQADKAVFEVLQEIKRNGWGRGGNLRMMLQVGAQKNITREQAILLTKYMDRGLTEYRNVTEAMERENVVKLEVIENEISFADAMHRMNEKLEYVKIVGSRGEKTIRRYFDLIHLRDIGVNDFDDLQQAKYFTVTK
ncbi:hypothetical protein [Bacillus cereus]|uniref:hypothetical protein n=1 Tax=Bacillus cereus TaxID=1396 RepID=UPI0024051FEF|nr:hypothetical protein [Bacillus cereus]MDF9638842.1 hypothetical protein [Bacillus cereus]